MKLEQLNDLLEKNFTSPVEFGFNGKKIIVEYKYRKILIITKPKDIFIFTFESYYNESTHKEILVQILQLLKQNNIEYEVKNKIFRKSMNLLNKIFKSKNIEKQSGEELQNCPDTMNYFYNILNHNGLYYKQGILIYYNNYFLGVYKQVGYGNQLLLNLENKLFGKLSLITLTSELRFLLNRIKLSNNQKNWKKVNLNGKNLKIHMTLYDYKFINNPIKMIDSKAFLMQINENGKKDDINHVTGYKYFIKECYDLYESQKNNNSDFDLEIYLDEIYKNDFSSKLN